MTFKTGSTPILVVLVALLVLSKHADAFPASGPLQLGSLTNAVERHILGKRDSNEGGEEKSVAGSAGKVVQAMIFGYIILPILILLSSIAAICLLCMWICKCGCFRKEYGRAEEVDGSA